MNNMYAGWHLIFDGVVEPGEASERLGDVDFLRTAFLDLVAGVGMEILVPPVFKVVPLTPENASSDLEDDGGVTGTCIITTSHISIHTWPLRSRFALDVFSCKEFNSEAVSGFLMDRFNVKTRSFHWIVRNWP